jgi:hypothetical protein
MEKEKRGDWRVFVFFHPPLSAVTNKPEAAGTTINKQIHHLHDAALIQPTYILQRNCTVYDHRFYDNR